MEFIKGWMLAIMGITILSTLTELILPEAEIKKYAKLIVGIIMIIIMIRPIASIKDIDILANEYQFKEQIATTDQVRDLEDVQWTQIQQEFSSRVSKMIVQKLGSNYSHLQIKADLNRDGINNIIIENATKNERDDILKLMSQEFQISSDKITFIGG